MQSARTRCRQADAHVNSDPSDNRLANLRPLCRATDVIDRDEDEDGAAVTVEQSAPTSDEECVENLEWWQTESDC